MLRFYLASCYISFIVIKEIILFILYQMNSYIQNYLQINILGLLFSKTIRQLMSPIIQLMLDHQSMYKVMLSSIIQIVLLNPFLQASYLLHPFHLHCLIIIMLAHFLPKTLTIHEDKVFPLSPQQPEAQYVAKKVLLISDTSFAVWIEDANSDDESIVLATSPQTVAWYALPVYADKVQCLSPKQIAIVSRQSVHTFSLQTSTFTVLCVLPQSWFDVYVFRQTSLVCLAGKNEDKFDLTYFGSNRGQVKYSFPLDDESGCSVYQLNQHSKVGFFVSSALSQTTKGFSLAFFDQTKLRSDLETYAIPYAFTEHYFPSEVAEVSADKYIVAFREERVELFEDSVLRDYCYLFLDASVKGTPICRKLEVGSHALDFLLFQGFSFRRYGSLLLAWSCANLDYPQSEVTIYEEGHHSVSLMHCQHKIYHDESVSEYSFMAEGEVDQQSGELTVRVGWQADLAFVYMMFLLHIDDNFDEDLLMDIITELNDQIF